MAACQRPIGILNFRKHCDKITAWPTVRQDERQHGSGMPGESEQGCVCQRNKRWVPHRIRLLCGSLFPGNCGQKGRTEPFPGLSVQLPEPCLRGRVRGIHCHHGGRAVPGDGIRHFGGQYALSADELRPEPEVRREDILGAPGPGGLRHHGRNLRHQRGEARRAEPLLQLWGHGDCPAGLGPGDGHGNRGGQCAAGIGGQRPERGAIRHVRGHHHPGCQEE